MMPSCTSLVPVTNSHPWEDIHQDRVRGLLAPQRFDPSCSEIQELALEEDIKEENIEEHIKQTEDLANKFYK